MDIVHVLGQVRALLRQEGRLSYRLLKRQFALDDEALDDLKYELIEVQEFAIDKDGKMLVWTGENSLASRVQSLESKTADVPAARRQTLDPK